MIWAGLDGPQEGHTSEVRRIQHVIRAGLNGPQEGGCAYTVRFGRASTGFKEEDTSTASDSACLKRALKGKSHVSRVIHVGLNGPQGGGRAYNV